MKLATLALIALAACVPELQPAPLPAADRPFERLPNTLWLEPSQLGYEEQQAWGLPLPEGFGVAFLPAEALLAGCRTVSNGCGNNTVGFAELAEDRVNLRDDLSGRLLHSVLLHEIGHILRGEGGHIADDLCTEADRPVMCEYTCGRIEPMPVDYEFVLGL
jgi:hypothetical protein